MEYRSLGRTGTKVSVLCLGCSTFGGKTDHGVAADIVDRALDAGVNFVDTSNSYARGLSEEAIGKAFVRNGKRGRVVLATKVHVRMADDDPNAQGNHRRHIVEQCEASLRRLKSEYIDLYQVHRPMSDIPIDETLRALDDLVRAGKVRYIGTSTFAAWQVMESLWVAKEYGLNRFISEQPPYHILERRIERELIPMAQTYGVAILPWSPLAGGFLSGKYKRGQAAPEDARHAQSAKGFPAAAYDAVEGLEAMALEKVCTVAQLALAWCIRQPGVTCPIIGARTVEQLEETLEAVSVEVSDEDRQRIDALVPPGHAVIENYTADFGPHRYRW